MNAFEVVVIGERELWVVVCGDRLCVEGGAA